MYFTGLLSFYDRILITFHRSQPTTLPSTSLGDRQGYGANSSNITGITQRVFSPTGEELIIFMLIITLLKIE
jgi:hypothetical protein